MFLFVSFVSVLQGEIALYSTCRRLRTVGRPNKSGADHLELLFHYFVIHGVLRYMLLFRLGCTANIIV